MYSENVNIKKYKDYSVIWEGVSLNSSRRSGRRKHGNEKLKSLRSGFLKRTYLEVMVN